MSTSNFDSESEHPGEQMISRLIRKGLVVLEIPVIPRHDIPKIGAEGLPLYRGHKVAVVVPAYNEELVTGETLAGIPDFVCRIYVVNDCSKDKTQEVINYYAGNDDSIIPVQHEQNKGVGAAIVTGYKRAMEDGMDIAAVMAGDHQMDPAFLPQLFNPIIDGKCDYTMGNRLVSPAYRKGMSTWRFFGNSVLTFFTKMASGYWQMMDPQNGYTAIFGRALECVSLGSLYPGYGYCNELLVEGDAPVACCEQNNIEKSVDF